MAFPVIAAIASAVASRALNKSAQERERQRQAIEDAMKGAEMDDSFLSDNEKKKNPMSRPDKIEDRPISWESL